MLNGMATTATQKHYRGLVDDEGMKKFAQECAKRQQECARLKREAPSAGKDAAAADDSSANDFKKAKKSHHRKGVLLYPLTRAMLRRTGVGRIRYEDLRRYKTAMCCATDPVTQSRYKVPVAQNAQKAEDYRKALLAAFLQYKLMSWNGPT